MRQSTRNYYPLVDNIEAQTQMTHNKQQINSDCRIALKFCILILGARDFVP